MDFKGNTINLKLFSEILLDSPIIVHNTKVYDPYQNKKDYYVIHEVSKLIDSNMAVEDVIERLENRYLLEEVQVRYDENNFTEDNFKLKLKLSYTGSNDILRINFDKDTSLSKLLTVDINNDFLIKELKYDRVPNEVSDEMERFVTEFKKHLEKANRFSVKINDQRKKLIHKYVEERVAYNAQQSKMKKILEQ